MEINRVSTKRDWHINQAPYNHIAGDIERIFKNHKESLAGVIDLSRRVRAGIQAITPFIEQNTSVVCPGCKEICCTNRHSYYNCEDLIYVYSLGIKAEEYKYNDAVGPCQFMAREGCSLERAIRPSGCNWYFCDSLYDRMEQLPGSAYGDFDNSLQEIAGLWMKMTEDFRIRFMEITGNEMKAIELISSSNRKAVKLIV